MIRKSRSYLSMFIHVFCQHLWISFGLIKRNWFLLFVCSIILHNVIAFFPLRKWPILLLNFFRFDIFCLDQLFLSLTQKALIFFLDAHRVALLLTAFRNWIFFIFRCASDQPFGSKSILVDCFAGLLLIRIKRLCFF